ncbi:MAG: squalene/phytoene synthase family protein [bacterium]|nr:squalene/phytoene synthase family protein [bacterium]
MSSVRPAAMAVKVQSAKKSNQTALAEVLRIAAAHRENFARFTWWLPKQARYDLLTLYAYCRTADDAADLPGSAAFRTDKLDDIEQNLHAALANKSAPSFYPAVAELIVRRTLPVEQFQYLLDAFRRDQIVTDWESLSDLIEYSEHSANPVGRLVLRILAPEQVNNSVDQASDYVCTALQLVNFWQDVQRDFASGRIYLPRDRREHFGVTKNVLQTGIATAGYRDLLRELCDDTRQRFETGRKGLTQLHGGVGFTIDWFATSGMRLLRKIELSDFDTLSQRLVVSKLDRGLAALQSLLRKKSDSNRQPLNLQQ